MARGDGYYRLHVRSRREQRRIQRRSVRQALVIGAGFAIGTFLWFWCVVGQQIGEIL